jgi:hypothetical protein
VTTPTLRRSRKPSKANTPVLIMASEAGSGTAQGDFTYQSFVSNEIKN